MPAFVLNNISLVAQLVKFGVRAYALRLVPQDKPKSVLMAHIGYGLKRIPEPLRVGLPVAGVHPAAAERFIPSGVHPPVVKRKAGVQPRLDP